MHDRKGQRNGLSAEKIIAHSYFSAKRSSVALMSCSLWYIMKKILHVCVCVCVCVQVCVSRLGLLSLHYTWAGSTPVLCPRSLPLPVPARNNELQWMPWGGWVSGLHFSSNYLSDLIQMAVSACSLPSPLSLSAMKLSVHTFSSFTHLRSFLVVTPPEFKVKVQWKSKENNKKCTCKTKATDRYSIIFNSVNNTSRLSGIYQFSQHSQPCVPFLLIPLLPPQDRNKNDSLNLSW